MVYDNIVTMVTQADLNKKINDVEKKYDTKIKELELAYELKLAKLEAEIKKRCETEFDTKFDKALKQFEKTLNDKVAVLMDIIKLKDVELGKTKKQM